MANPYVKKWKIILKNKSHFSENSPGYDDKIVPSFCKYINCPVRIFWFMATLY